MHISLPTSTKGGAIPESQPFDQKFKSCNLIFQKTLLSKKYDQQWSPQRKRKSPQGVFMTAELIFVLQYRFNIESIKDFVWYCEQRKKIIS